MDASDAAAAGRTFRRGAALSIASTFGFAENSDRGRTAGNGFDTRWPDDLVVLTQAGITDVRVGLDWARLQPRPDRLDAEWVERFAEVLTAAESHGLRVWAALHDGSIPTWFDDEGGLDDDEAFVRWWPRWVERAAEAFGDGVDGWIPFARIPDGAPDQPWRDTWGILHGVHPVVASVGVDSSVHPYVGQMDQLGLALATTWERDGVVGDRELEMAATEWGNRLRDAADAVDTPVMVAGFCPGHDDPDAAARIVGQLVESLDDAIGDGVRLDLCVVDPAIAAPDDSPGVFDADRALTPAGEVYVA